MPTPNWQPRCSAQAIRVHREDAAGPEIIAALHVVLRGRTYDLAEDVLARLAEPRAARAATPTPRQRDVARLLVEGRTVKEIAATLGLSTRTVETQKYQALDALGLRTTADLIRYALEHGLVAPSRHGSDSAGAARPRLLRRAR